MTENENHEIPNCKDFLANMGPIDSLLGSLSYNEIDNADGKTQQLRTSARVFKKMKFDLSNNAALEKEKKEEAKPEEVKPEVVVKKSVNPQWTSEEKSLFFEALNEYGKDFETIYTSVCNRLKKKGYIDDMIKTKFQFRHFYYKTFHMLLINLKFNEKVPKNVQELYTLINYGEMRRKVGSISKKSLSKLGELIAKGSIHVRLKGKTIRIKTPNCRALRRLNQLDEKYDDLKLPTRVLVELRPKDMVTFLKMQSIALNPRIKVACVLQKRLSSLITCINTRWKDSEAVVYDKAVISTNNVTKDCVPDQKIIDESQSLLTPQLRLAPLPDAHVELPLIDISEYFTGQSISLTAFEMRKGVRPKEEVKKEEPEPSVSKIEKSTKQTSEESTTESLKSSVNKDIDEAVNTILSLQEQSKSDIKIEVGRTHPKDIPLEEKQTKIAKIREGWTAETCGALTVGELYLMAIKCGADSRVVLEYNWEPIEIKSQPDEVKEPTINKEENDLTNPLKKLLSLAKLHSAKTVMKCTCGHVCGSKSNNTAQFKKPLTPRVVKKSQVIHDHPPAEEKVNGTKANLKESKEEPKPEETPVVEQFSDNNPVVKYINQRDSMSRLNSKVRSRNRTRYKQLVVERKLVPNKSEYKHQIVSMNIVSQENSPNEELTKKKDSPKLLGSELPSLLLNGTNTSTKVDEESCIPTQSFSGLLDDNPSSNMSTGISKILKENENQWINSDVADYSLSSLLGHLDCQTKTNDDTHISNMSQDVDAQLHNLLIETSVDYTAKFADLAAQVADNKK